MVLWSFFCRGRNKRTIFILLLLNVLVYIEVFNLRRRAHEIWQNRTREDDDFFEAYGIYTNTLIYKEPNVSDQYKHRNNYSPVPGAGDGGTPVIVPRTARLNAQNLYQLHSYNIIASDRISIERKLPDMRSYECKQVKYNINKLPTASVVIVFYNEAWSALMRTVMSVLNRSPYRLLKQVILVDDASDRRYLGKELEEAVSKLKRVSIYRSTTRSGLVSGRLMGARAATGDVLVFLDAHCEVTPGWLEPLLDRAGSSDVFVSPYLDVISDQNLAYKSRGSFQWGTFSWRLSYGYSLPSQETISRINSTPSQPYATPILPGGLFAVRRELFWHLGSFDEDMQVVGAENLELSWRAWQCGARVEISPCSRIGHIFRTLRPYKFPGGMIKVLASNFGRAVLVWTDEWADFFVKFSPPLAVIRESLNVDVRKAFRRSFGCKSFTWYLNNIWPEHYFPTKDRWFGRIKNKRGACLSSVMGLTTGSYCGSDMEIEKLLIYTHEGRIMANEGLCLSQDNFNISWDICSSSTKQIWLRDRVWIRHFERYCLTLEPKVSDNINLKGITDELSLKKCGSTEGQMWFFETVPWR